MNTIGEFAVVRRSTVELLLSAFLSRSDYVRLNCSGCGPLAGGEECPFATQLNRGLLRLPDPETVADYRLNQTTPVRLPQSEKLLRGTQTHSLWHSSLNGFHQWFIRGAADASDVSLNRKSG